MMYGTEKDEMGERKKGKKWRRRRRRKIRMWREKSDLAIFNRAASSLPNKKSTFFSLQFLLFAFYSTFHTNKMSKNINK